MVDTFTMHWGRSWSGHEIEDACRCEQHPCGLVSYSTVDQECPQHGAHFAKTTRQGHRAQACPGRTEES